MSDLKIVRYPHPALRAKVTPLTTIDKQVRLHAEKMLELMYEAHGLGLAANQVALPYQLIVVNPTGDPEQKEFERVLINPEIIEKKGSIEGEEGCLSFPELYQKVRRARTCKVRYFNLEGLEMEAEAHELASRLFQHEVDHLHGVLFIDKMGFLARRSSRAALEELERQYRKGQERGENPPEMAL
ncbi:MAG: peptide deformylase [Gemmataceae bacterium]